MNGLVAAEQTMASPATYAKRFGSLDMAYQRARAGPHEDARSAVLEKLRARANRVDQYDDYFVLDRSLSVLIRPSVPLPFGYREYSPASSAVFGAQHVHVDEA